MSKHIASATKGEALKFVGLDVHKNNIAIAVADQEGVRSVGMITNDLDQLRKMLRKLGPPSALRVCYEAGPCGYVVYRYLKRLKIDCVIVAPSLIPKKAGDRVKTDRRDALGLARLLRSDELTSIWVPDAAHEALRDLIRGREDSVEDRQRARHRLAKFLLRLGITAPAGRPWTLRHRHWLNGLRFEDPAQQLVFNEYLQNIDDIAARITRYDRAIEIAAGKSQHAPVIAALQAMQGIKLLTAATIVAEVGDLTRFKTPRQLMAYAGVVPSEYSSGGKTRRGCITKTGNSHLRRTIIESAWHYRHRPSVSAKVRERRRDLPASVCAIASQAQQRLHHRYVHLSARGKIKQQVVVAVGRELLAFAWSIAQTVQALNSIERAVA